MYCSYCGNKIEKDSKYCSSCGRELNQTPKEEPTNKEVKKVHNSITRKSIKKDAMAKNKGPLYLGTIMFIVAIIIIMVLMTTIFGTKTLTASGNYEYYLSLTDTTVLNAIIISIIFMIVSMYFTLGMNKTCLDISRDKQVKIGTMFLYPLKNIKLYLKLIVINILVYLILEALTYIPIIGIILYLAIAIYIIPVLGILPYIIMDNEDIGIIEAVKRTITTIKGNRVAYYALIFTFIGWYMLSILTLGLLIIFILPYMSVAISNFYLSIIKEKEYNDAPSGISNEAVVGITIGSYVTVFVVIIIAAFTFGFITSLKEEVNSNNDDVIIQDNDDKYENNLSGETINISGLDVYIPDGYNEITVANYTKAYMSGEGDIVIGLITTDLGYDVASNQYANFYKNSFSSAYTCGDVSTRNFNHYNWEVLDCNGTGVNIRNYIAIQNRKLYLLTISYEQNAIFKTENLYFNIEKELAFANTVA